VYIVHGRVHISDNIDVVLFLSEAKRSCGLNVQEYPIRRIAVRMFI